MSCNCCSYPMCVSSPVVLSLTLTSCRGLTLPLSLGPDAAALFGPPGCRCVRAMTSPLSLGPEAAVVFGSLTPPLCMDLTPPLYSGLLPEATDRALIELRRSVVIRTAIVSDASLKSAVDTSRHWRLTTASCTVDRATATNLVVRLRAYVLFSSQDRRQLCF